MQKGRIFPIRNHSQKHHQFDGDIREIQALAMSQLRSLQSTLAVASRSQHSPLFV